MLSLNATQQSLIAASSKRLTWLFTVTTLTPTTYRWSTKAVSFGGNAYSFKVIPSSFPGITLNRAMSELGIQAPSTLSFDIPNSGSTLAASDFIGATVQVDLVLSDWTNEAICATWKFRVISCTARYQRLSFVCEDFIQQYLRGDYPKTALVKELAPSTDASPDDNLCVSLPFGEAYVPLRSVYISADSQRFYVLGPQGVTYTVSLVHSPRDWPGKSEWSSAGFTLNQYDKTLSGVGYRVLEPIIADSDSDGTADAMGLWKQGDKFLDMPAQFTRSDTSALTGPAAVLEYILEDFGVPSANIDTGAGSTFAAAATTYASWGLTWNGALFTRESRQRILARLLAMCHSTLVITDKVELHVLSAASVDTVLKADVVRSTITGQGRESTGEGTFRRQGATSKTVNDSGYGAFQEADTPQDTLLKFIVAADSTTASPASGVLELPWIQDSQIAQKLAILHYQRSLLRKENLSFEAKLSLLALQPDDVTTISDAAYGGTYDALIESITIHREGKLSLSCVTFTSDLDDWGDLSPSAITYADDASTYTYTTVVSGPDDAPTTGNQGNLLQGRVRLVSGDNSIVLDPATVRVQLFESTDERVRIGDLNGIAGHTSTVWGFAAAMDADNYISVTSAGLNIVGGSGGVSLSNSGLILTIPDTLTASSSVVFRVSGSATDYGLVGCYKGSGYIFLGQSVTGDATYHTTSVSMLSRAGAAGTAFAMMNATGAIGTGYAYGIEVKCTNTGYTELNIVSVAAATSTVNAMTIWSIRSTGTPAAGFGTTHKIQLETAPDNYETAYSLVVDLQNVSSGAEDGRLRFYYLDGGAEVNYSQVYDGLSSYFTSFLIKPGSNSTTAAQIQNAAGTAIVICDTTNSRFGINIAPSYTLDVSGTGRISTSLITAKLIGNSGLIIRPSSNSTSAVTVKNAAETSTVVTVDTTNLRVGFGTATSPDYPVHAQNTGSWAAMFDAITTSESAMSMYLSCLATNGRAHLFLQSAHASFSMSTNLTDAGTQLQLIADVNAANPVKHRFIECSSTAKGLSLDCVNNGAGSTAYNCMTWDVAGNIGIGVTSWGTAAARVLGFTNAGAAPSSSPANMAQMWCEDVSSSAELRVRDEGGTVSTISPHNFTLFQPAADEPLPWSHYSENAAIGKRVNVDMAGAIREVERLSGKKFIYIEDIPITEDWYAVQREALIEQYIKDHTVTQEVSAGDALTAGEMVEVDDTTQKPTGSEIVEYQLSADGTVEPVTRPIHPKKSVLQRQLKKDVRFNPATGRFILTTAPTRAHAEAALDAEKPEIKGPAWLLARLPKKQSENGRTTQ